jgi:hypothetical protein
MHIDWQGARTHRIVKRFLGMLSGDEQAAFNECLMRLCHDPRADGICKVPYETTIPGDFFLYRDEQFTMLYQWEPLGKRHKNWNYGVLVLGPIFRTSGWWNRRNFVRSQG